MPNNPFDPGLCPHKGKPIYIGMQEDGKGGKFPLFNCPDCHSTLSMRTIEQHRKERGNGRNNN